MQNNLSTSHATAYIVRTSSTTERGTIRMKTFLNFQTHRRIIPLVINRRLMPAMNASRCRYLHSTYINTDIDTYTKTPGPDQALVVILYVYAMLSSIRILFTASVYPHRKSKRVAVYVSVHSDESNRTLAILNCHLHIRTVSLHYSLIYYIHITF